MPPACAGRSSALSSAHAFRPVVGHAQAQAARDAAETATQSTRRQTLRDLHWTVLTAYPRAASECMEATGQLYTSSRSQAEVKAEVERPYRSTDSRNSSNLSEFFHLSFCFMYVVQRCYVVGVRAELFSP